MGKRKISSTLDFDLMSYLELSVKSKKFSSISHGLEYCVYMTRKIEESK